MEQDKAMPSALSVKLCGRVLQSELQKAYGDWLLTHRPMDKGIEAYKDYVSLAMDQGLATVSDYEAAVEQIDSATQNTNSDTDTVKVLRGNILQSFIKTIDQEDLEKLPESEQQLITQLRESFAKCDELVNQAVALWEDSIEMGVKTRLDSATKLLDKDFVDELKK